MLCLGIASHIQAAITAGSAIVAVGVITVCAVASRSQADKRHDLERPQRDARITRKLLGTNHRNTESWDDIR